MERSRAPSYRSASDAEWGSVGHQEDIERNFVVATVIPPDLSMFIAWCKSLCQFRLGRLFLRFLGIGP